MKDPEQEQERALLLDAFKAGWQAALAVQITHPRVLAVIESCFEGWLVEAADEVELFGLPFRRREDLPRLVRARAAERERERAPSGPPGPAPVRVPAAAFEGTPISVGLSPNPAT